MITVRKAIERGKADFGWLDTSYTFSFNNYYDPRFMGFRALRVINEDFVAGGRGFPTHGHSDMEIITYVISGALAHKDSSGGAGVIRPHEIQRMTAGSGIRHSEYNHSETEQVHLYQIWLLPDEDGLEPGYEQKFVEPEEKRGKLKLIAAPGGSDDGAVNINTNAKVYASILENAAEIEYELEENRHAWIQVVEGSIETNGEILETGDGAAISNETKLKIKATADESEFLLFDLA